MKSKYVERYGSLLVEMDKLVVKVKKKVENRYTKVIF